MKRKCVIAFALLMKGACAGAGNGAEDSSVADWVGRAPAQIEKIEAPFAMPPLDRPVFRDQVFNVADHGAQADKEELRRFVNDSEMYVLATQAMIHKENAAILKARMLQSNKADKGAEFIREMEASVEVVRKLAALTTGTYLYGNDLMPTHWKDKTLKEFTGDLAAQKKWLESFGSQSGAKHE
jgi:hypothetical protein